MCDCTTPNLFLKISIFSFVEVVLYSVVLYSKEYPKNRVMQDLP